MRHTSSIAVTLLRPATARAVVLPVAILLASSTAQSQGDSFRSGGVQLHYKTAGEGAPVVLLSGGPGFDVEYLMPAAAFLPAGYKRIFLEQRGTGRSRVENMTPDNMTLRVVVEDLEALRVHLKQERLFLVGHSWGGMLAMAYAAEYGTRVERLILIGSGGPTMEFAARFSDNISARLRPEDVEARSYWNSASQRGVDRDKAAVGSVKAILPGYFFDRKNALGFAAAMKDGSYHPAVNALVMGNLIKSYDLRPGLQTLDRPVLIIQGHQDPIGDKTAEDIHALLRGSSLQYLDKCGHFPWIEQPEEFRRIISAFLVGSPGGRAAPVRR